MCVCVCVCVCVLFEWSMVCTQLIAQPVVITGWGGTTLLVRYIQGRGPCIIVGRCLATKVFIGKVLLTRGV